MKTLALMLTIVMATAPMAAGAVTPVQEKQFVDTYRKAYEGKDTKTLHSLLYSKGADAKALGFYKMMMTDGMGEKIASIELQDLNAADKARASEKMPSPDGRSLVLSLPPVKKLVIRKETKGKTGSSTSMSTVFVAEQDGRLWIPVPMVAK